MSFLSTFLLLWCFCSISSKELVNNFSTIQDDVNVTMNGAHLKSIHCSSDMERSSIRNASNYTEFLLYSRDTGLNYTEILLGNTTSVTTSTFSVNKSTKILIHGWLDNPFTEFGKAVRDAYLQNQDVNLINVDWSKLADTKYYPLAWLEVKPVGKYIAELVDWLVSEVGISTRSVHIIGLSLGAHIAGVVGEQVTAGKIGRISGLDPAGPGFGFWTSGRLDSSDAEFVDVIHTCGHWFGYYYPCGHVDFYPNNGMYNQPGCSWDLGSCSHLRVYMLYAESVSSLGFLSRQCDSWSNFVKGHCDNNTIAVMGENVDPSARGKFYLHTAGSSPFALGNLTERNPKI